MKHLEIEKVIGREMLIREEIQQWRLKFIYQTEA